VFARVGSVGGERVARVDCAGVLVVTEVSGQVNVFAAGGRIARVDGASVLVVADGSEFRGVGALCGLV